MVEEQAEVTALDGSHAWVSCRAQAGCARCAEGRGCGGGVIGRWLGDRLHRVRVLHDGGIAVGDCVVIGIDERVLVYAAATVYGIPLTGLFLGAGLAQWWYRTDVAAMAGALLGLAAGFAAVRTISRRMRTQRLFEPAVLRRSVSAESK